MEQDAGAIVEKIVRRSGISIAELARRINVDRRSIYYWFKQESLNADIIYKVGRALDYDFSTEFPNLIKNHTVDSHFSINGSADDAESVQYWKHKYIALLEKYNELLVQMNS